MMITTTTLERTAARLLSDRGENPEYDRALVELVTDLEGLTQDDQEAVRARLRRAYRRLEGWARGVGG